VGDVDGRESGGWAAPAVLGARPQNPALSARVEAPTAAFKKKRRFNAARVSRRLSPIAGLLGALTARGRNTPERLLAGAADPDLLECTEEPHLEERGVVGAVRAELQRELQREAEGAV
jgi:CRISPR-associated Cas5-like protein